MVSREDIYNVTRRDIYNDERKRDISTESGNTATSTIETPARPYSCIIHDPRAQPRIRIVVLIKVPRRPSPSQTRDGRIRRAERDVVLLVEKVGRVPREVRGREQTLVVAQVRRGPFPHTAVGAFPAVFVETCRSTILV